MTTIENLGGEQAAYPCRRPGLRCRFPSADIASQGMLMAAASLLAKNPQPTDEDIDSAMTNKCRCGTYPRIRAAIHHAAERGREGGINQNQ